MKKIHIKWEAVITVIISLTGLIVSIQATKISDLQTMIARNSSLPNIQIEARKEYDEITGKEDEFVIEISNLDGRINNYDAQTITFLRCDYLDKAGNFYKVEVPIFSYYFVGFRSGNNIGVLEERKTVGNGSKIIQLQRDINEYREESGEILNVSIDTYIQISYVDLLGEEQVQYYLVNLLKSQLLDENLGENKFDKYSTYLSLVDKEYGIDPNKVTNIYVEELLDIIRNVYELEFEDNKIQIKKEGDEMIFELINNVSADGWIGFVGNIISALITAISIIATILITRKQMKQQQRQLIQPYYDALLESLPSFDAIITQADYLNEEDGLLGGFTSSETKLYILETRYSGENISEEEKANLEYKINKQKEYIEYWNKTNAKIENFINSGYYNAVKSACDGKVIICYYNFIAVFHNEHCAWGPVIETKMLQARLEQLVDAINKSV